jgi:hypothetical protein
MTANRTTPAALTINAMQAALLRPVLRVHLHTLRDLLEAQVQALPPGDDAWANTFEEVDQLHHVLNQLEGVR